MVLSCCLPRQTRDLQQINPTQTVSKTEHRVCVPAEVAKDFNCFRMKERWISVLVQKGMFQPFSSVPVICILA